MKFSNVTLNIFAIFLSSLFAHGQELLVLDKETNSPLGNAAIFNKAKNSSTLTDNKGRASLEMFPDKSVIFIQLLGYETTEITLDFEAQERIQVRLNHEEQSLDEVILSVARSEITRTKIAEKVTVIKTNDIQYNAPSTGAELLELSPGVRLQKSQGGGGSPVLRGFEANRVLLVVDGIRMNNAIYRSGHLQNSITIDPHNIDRVEVTFGSSSVGYGSDALGGVIHYYTKSPKINAAEKETYSFTSDFASATMSHINNLSASLSFKNWGSLTSLSFSSFGDVRIGKNRPHGYEDWGKTPFYSENTASYYTPSPTPNENPLIQKNSGYDQVDVFQKFLVNLKNQKQFSLNFQFSTSSNIPRYDKLAEESNNSLRHAEWYYGPQKRLLIAPRLKFFGESKWLKKGSLIFAYQNIWESRIQRSFSSLNKEFQEEKLNVLSINGDFDTDFNKASFSYGFEGTYNHVNSIAYSRMLEVSGNEIRGFGGRVPIPTRYPSDGSSYASFASYFNWVWDISPLLTLNAGIRFTYTELYAKWKEEVNINSLLSTAINKSEALTETLALIYRPSLKTQWNVLVSNGFRNPNIDDIGKIRENKGQLLVPNSFLKPEYAYNFDVGLLKYSTDQKGYLSLRGFTTLISRHISRSNFTIFADTTTSDLETILYNGEEVTTTSNKNLGNRFIYGGSIDVQLALSRTIDVSGSANYTKASNNNRYGPLPSISPFFGNLQLKYETANWQLSARFDFSGKKNSSDYSWGGEDGLDETPEINSNAENITEQYAGTPAWTDFQILSQYHISNRMNLRVGIENIFDVHYRTFASGISAPGRNLRVGLHITF